MAEVRPMSQQRPLCPPIYAPIRPAGAHAVITTHASRQPARDVQRHRLAAFLLPLVALFALLLLGAAVNWLG